MRRHIVRRTIVEPSARRNEMTEAFAGSTYHGSNSCMMLSNRMTANRRLEKAARHASARMANWRSDSAPSVTFPWLSDLLLARRLRLRRLSSSAGDGSSWSSVEVTSESIVAIFDFARGMRARPVSKTPICNSYLGRKKGVTF